MGPTLLRFGDFQFDPDGPLLTYESRSLELAPKALEILAVLLKNAGQVVRKYDLLSLVWPKIFVEEGNLAVHVSLLRKALAKHGDVGDIIETVPKRGYRFIAPVRVVSRRTSLVSNETSALFDLVDHYLQQDTAAAWRRASATCEKCIEIDPLNARAGLADSLLMRFVPGDLEPEKLAGAAASLLAEAGKIDPSSPEVHLSRSRLHFVWHWNWQTATEEVQHAAELATNRTTELIAQAWGGLYLALLAWIED